MKYEMSMQPNGNYEKIVSPIQHKCTSKNGIIQSIEYGCKDGLYLKIESGDLYEDGYSHEEMINFCPFCGYQTEIKGKRDFFLSKPKEEDLKNISLEEFKKSMMMLIDR